MAGALEARAPGAVNGKSAAAFRTISEVAAELALPQHVLRFWESKFPHIRPLKRGGGRRYYRPEDVTLLRRIRDLLYREGYTIKGVQKLLRQNSLIKGATPDDGESDGNGDAGAAVTAAPAPPIEPPTASMSEATRDEIKAVLSDLEELRGLLRQRPAS